LQNLIQFSFSDTNQYIQLYSKMFLMAVYFHGIQLLSAYIAWHYQGRFI